MLKNFGERKVTGPFAVVLQKSKNKTKIRPKPSALTAIYIPRYVFGICKYTMAVAKWREMRTIKSLMESEEALSFGCQSLNSLFGNGISLRAGITEIAGESSAGKSQWMMMLAVRVCYL